MPPVAYLSLRKDTCRRTGSDQDAVSGPSWIGSLQTFGFGGKCLISRVIVTICRKQNPQTMLASLPCAISFDSTKPQRVFANELSCCLLILFQMHFFFCLTKRLSVVQSLKRIDSPRQSVVRLANVERPVVTDLNAILQAFLGFTPSRPFSTVVENPIHFISSAKIQNARIQHRMQKQKTGS